MSKTLCYETIDWELEARKVAAAFGVEGECEFDEGRYLHAKGHYAPLCSNGLFLYVDAGGDTFYFVLGTDSQANENESGIEIYFDGGIYSLPKPESNPRTSHELAKALFYLDLLTPEVETALGVTLTTHERIELTNQYTAKHPRELWPLTWQGERE